MLGSKVKLNNKLYRHIRAIRNPVKRLVDLYPALVYGGALDLNDPTKGAVPIDTDNKALLPAIAQLWKWSNWDTEKSGFVRTGAMLGDSFIKLVDNPDKRKVYMEVLDPSKVRDADFDAQGNIQSRMIIEYETADALPITEPGQREDTSKSYLYTEIIEKLDDDLIRFRTFKDKEPFGFTNDAEGKPVSEWEMTYGFIPAVHVPHTKLRGHWGFVPFHGVYDKIHEANDFASHLNDQVRNAVDIIWYFAGVAAAEEINAKPTSMTRESRRDQVTALYGPEGSKPEPMIAPLDVGGALEILNSQLDEITRDLPELAMHQAREQLGSASGIAIKNMYSDADGLITEAQGNYDGGLVRAQMMGVSIGALQGYDGFQAFNADSYTKGDLTHRIKPRPIFADDSMKQSRLTALPTIKDQPPSVQRLMMEELDYPKKDIDEVVADAEAQQQSARQDQINANDATAVQGLLDKMGLGNSASPAPQDNQTDLAGVLANGG